MKVSKFLMLNMIAGMSLSSGMQAMDAIEDLKGSKQGPYRQGPRREPKIVGEPDPVVSERVRMTPKQQAQQIASLKKDISSTHKNMLKLVDEVAGKNLAKKIQLLENISMHERQSEISLEAYLHKGKAQNKSALTAAEKAAEIAKIRAEMSHNSGGQFPGCPYCG